MTIENNRKLIDWLNARLKAHMDARADGGPFQRNLDADFEMVDGECLFVIDYLDMTTYDLTLLGDADLVIVGPVFAGQAHIIDADGTLADVTAKFNTLLSELEAYRILDTS